MTKEPATKGLLTMSWYTYVVECSDGSYYVGITHDVQSRIAEHNAGNCITPKPPPIVPRPPWPFTDREQALAFERHLKSPSGRAFARKRL